MNKFLIGCICALLFAQTGFGQDKFFTKSGSISFFSKASLDNIEANNDAVTCVLDSKTGNLQFAVLMKSFQFQKALMQEHFNENYVESDKYPKSEFKGSISNNGSINYTKDGEYPAKVQGKLTLHGITKDLSADGKVKVAQGKVNVISEFTILLSDYQIKIPALVKDKVSETIKVSVNCALAPLK